MQPTIGRVVLVKWTSGEGRNRLGWVTEGQEYAATVTAVGEALDVNINLPQPSPPLMQGRVPVTENEVGSDGLSWRWPPRV